MPNIQIKDVPEDTHAVLRQRASAAHQSLQEYLRSRLIAEAARPTIDEVLDRAGGRAGGSLPLRDAVERAAVRPCSSLTPRSWPSRWSTTARTATRSGTGSAVRPWPRPRWSTSRWSRSGAAWPAAGTWTPDEPTWPSTDLQAIPIQRVDHTALLERCWELRDNLTTYDAAYVALAEALQVTLLTGDQRLARAPGPTCPIEVIKAKPSSP